MITVTVSVKDYLERLKYIQSHTRKYKQHMREFRSKEEANKHQTYNRTVLGIMDMLSNTVTIDYDEHNRPKSRVSDDIDRMIIGQKLAAIWSLLLRKANLARQTSIICYRQMMGSWFPM